jgi:hypothetical protein
MHPRQAKLLNFSAAILDKTAAKAGKRRGGANLWKYVCPETEKDFYLPVKQTTVRSPYTGKSFTAKPEKDTLADVGKELKNDAKAEKASKKAALLDILNGDFED